MAFPLPSTYYACPCSSSSTSPPSSTRLSSSSSTADDADEQTPLNPHSLRSAYNLYPLTHLLYCDECAAIRCPKCVSDEVLNWYCPGCLFEVPSSGVRADGNRCSRNCIDCPACEAPLQVTQAFGHGSNGKDGRVKEGGGEDGGQDGYLLFCQYCGWTTLEIGVVLKRQTKVTEQLARIRRSRMLGSPAVNERGEPAVAEEDANGQGDDEREEEKAAVLERRSHDDAFEKLTAFYKEQLSESGDAQAAFSNSNYSSPANLARIMSLYGGLSYGALKKSREKPQPMREALNHNEGFATCNATSDSENDTIKTLQTAGWNGTVSEHQRLSAPLNHSAIFTDELWPTATKLRTKRGKRCRTCRQIIIRPESKVSSTRYKIRHIAHNNIPRLSLKPFTTVMPSTAIANPSFVVRSELKYEDPLLRPGVPVQYILTLRNPVFEIVKVTLATPAVTPGRVGSRVTILCNEFTLGPAGDVWDDALSSSTSSTTRTGDGGRREAMASLTGEADRQPEAGKVWERSRNSTSVVLEIVPGDLAALEVGGEGVGEDEDVLEVPIYVRAEWTADVHGVKGDPREAREVGYWCVLGVGRISG